MIVANDVRLKVLAGNAIVKSTLRLGVKLPAGEDAEVPIGIDMNIGELETLVTKPILLAFTRKSVMDSANWL